MVTGCCRGTITGTVAQGDRLLSAGRHTMNTSGYRCFFALRKESLAKDMELDGILQNPDLLAANEWLI